MVEDLHLQKAKEARATGASVTRAPAGRRAVSGADRTQAAGASAEWDAFAARQPGDTIVQTTAWAEAKRRLGFDSRHIVIRDEDAIMGGAIIITRHLRLYGSIGYIARGPLLRDGDDTTASRTLAAVERAARDSGIGLLIVQPAEGSEWADGMLGTNGYIASLRDVAPTATMRIDLRQDLERILAAMTSTRRRHIRAVEKRNVLRLRPGSSADVELFHRLHCATATRQGFAPMSLDYLRGHWEALDPRGWVQLVVAEIGNAPVAGLWLTSCGDSLVYRLGGWGGAAANDYPNEACHWFALRWAKENGFRYYDLGGVDRQFARTLAAGDTLTDAQQHSPAAFKRKFGGEVTLLPLPRLKVLNPIARPFAHAVLMAAGRSRLAGHLADRLRAG